MGYLLAPCLGGDGKTLMFVNVSPDEDSGEETSCSLKFAAQVNAVELGKGCAKRNVTSGINAKPAQEKDTDKSFSDEERKEKKSKKRSKDDKNNEMVTKRKNRRERHD